MWVTKIIIPPNEGMLIGSKTKKHNITVMGYPLSHFFKNKRLYVLSYAYLVGENSAKKNFLRDIKKDKRTIKIEMMNNDSCFWLIQQHSGMKGLFDPMIVYIKPMIVSSKGEYILEIASWNKDKLMSLSKVARTKLYGGKLIYIKKQKVKTIHFMSLIPNLTEKQKRAIELAIENGYYGYPRKSDLAKLAKLMKVSYSTYSFHLRNAEKKLMPYIYQNISSIR